MAHSLGLALAIAIERAPASFAYPEGMARHGIIAETSRIVTVFPRAAMVSFCTILRSRALRVFRSRRLSTVIALELPAGVLPCRDCAQSKAVRLRVRNIHISKLFNGGIVRLSEQRAHLDRIGLPKPKGRRPSCLLHLLA